MKKLLFVLLTFITLTFSLAQVQNLKDLSTGVLEQSSRLNDNKGNVIGYAFIFNKGLINEEKYVQYEYVLLDNNLNKITNGDFELRNILKLSYRFTGIEFLKQKLYINSKLYHVKKYGEYGNVLVKLDLKSNKTENVEFYRNGGFTSFSEIEGFDKMKAFNTIYSANLLTMYKGENQIYYVDFKIGVGNFLESINVYNENYENTFSYVIDKKMKKDGYKFELGTFKNDQLVLLQKKIDESSGSTKIGVERLLTYSLADGKNTSNIIYNTKTNRDGMYVFPEMEFQNDKLFVIGDIKESKENAIPFSKNGPSIGLMRTIYDNEGKQLLEKRINYSEIFSDIGFKSLRDQDGYRYALKEYFNYNDNSFTVLLEKQKGDNSFTVVRSTDYIIANFDSNGIFKNHIVLEKSKQKMFDSYLFSQENKDENEVLFFYAEQDKDDKKSWNLIINKLKNGVLTQDKMPFKTKETTMRFGKAKYGYIFISEYNKDEKESSVRIEKLNL
ncbi:DUF6770 family protein [Empedobacter brevis]|uniref:DUF6770 family protein n=1 Tax=Empedobacter brevis TaxID=247 RepID=UPI0028AFD750|nr:DUF6770 family protein [Empedobacter brevis]